MNKKRISIIMFSLLLAIMIVMAGCSDNNSNTSPANEQANDNLGEEIDQPVETPTDTEETPEEPIEEPVEEPSSNDTSKPADESNDSQQAGEDNAVQVIANPNDVTVLVNKTFRLPEGHAPSDLIEPNIPFIFEEKLEKRKVRKAAGEALEKMFAAAEQDNIYLAGVSGYRSHAHQTSLFNNYVKRDGIEAASKYSARPGHSEHETGLAMDVSGSTGKCAAQDCFGGTDEAIWLDEHAAEHGFIIRYPEGKDAITGYQYEPWHLRYVGTDISMEIAEKDITLEEYFGDAVPVTNP